jgi:ribosomal protein S18 acetylase RimI-like enzyme
MQVDRCSLVQITKEYMSRNIDKFLSIEFNWTDIGETPWGQKSFLLDLPRKWDFSFALERKELIAGYIIGSQEGDRRAKVNKIVIDSGCRRKGLGRQLIHRFEQECSNSGVYEVELKALIKNASANKFYAKLGYQLTGSVEGSDGQVRNTFIKRLER